MLLESLNTSGSLCLIQSCSVPNVLAPDDKTDERLSFRRAEISRNESVSIGCVEMRV
jgi:hypothetical protein